jgi:hypothetical protein
MSAFVTKALRRLSVRVPNPHPDLYLSEERSVRFLSRTGEIQRQHARNAYSCTEAPVVALRETLDKGRGARS